MWIEDVNIDELKLEYSLYKRSFKEFRVLLEMTYTVLQNMGIFLKPLQNTKTSGLIKNRFDEFDEDELEQLMEDGQDNGD